MRDGRMRPERLCAHVPQTGLFHTQMTGATTIRNAQLRHPDLLQSSLKSPQQGGGLPTAPNQSEVLRLVTRPLPETIFGRGDRQADQQDNAERAERARA